MSRSNTFNPGQRIELTPRQEDVVRLIAGGLTNSEIADRLGVTLDGVKWHVREILGKFGVESREQAAELWKQENAVGRRMRNWSAGLWAATGVRWAGGLAVAGGAGIVGVVAIVQSLEARDGPEMLPGAEVVNLDRATNEGLTLKVEKMEADDIQTIVTVTLEGRPELGRFGSPGFSGGAGQIVLRDQDGRTYPQRGLQMLGSQGPRAAAFVFEPLAATVKSVTLEVHGAEFVAPAAETDEGELPPRATSTVAGPWLVTITEFDRRSSSRTPIHSAPQAFVSGTVVLEEVLQLPGSTVIRMHWFGMPRTAAVFPEMILLNSAGNRVSFANSGTGWGNPDDPELIEQGFAEVHGSVTLTLSPQVHQIPDASSFVCIREVERCRSEEEKAQMIANSAIEAAQLQAVIDSQPPATWTFTLP